MLLTKKTVIIKSQVPQALAGKGPATSSAVAWTMYQKYANGLPLYRQEKDWEQYGAQISRTTLANWIIYCSQNYFHAVPKGKPYDYSQPAVQRVRYCNRLFAIEDSIHKKYPGDYEKRKQLRLEKEKPVLEAFWSWLEQQKPARNTRMDKAVNYVLNRKDSAETYLEDGRCSFTNNLSENAIRPFAVGRKNWLFSDSVEGANASAEWLFYREEGK